MLARALTLTLLVLTASDAQGGGGPNPNAPLETMQFAFLVGDWDCTTRFMRPDRSYIEGRARWTGHWILDGWAIQDDWISPQPDGSSFRGTNIRSFNRETGKWDNRWLPQGSLQWKFFEAQKIGETMVMIGGEGRDPVGEFVDRNVFYDIGGDGWKWRKDRSYDGGESWIEGVGHIEAVRAGTAGSLLERVEHGFVDNGGVKLHYAALGQGPLVVLLHGFPDYWYTWRHQMAALAARYRVVAVDLRGYNKSDKPDGVEAYAMRHLIGDVVAVVRHFGEQKAILVGHDWGGAIAWLTATWAPQVVDRLIVLSTPHPNGLARELAANPEQQRGSEYARRFQQEGAHEGLSAEELASWVEDPAARALYVEAFRRSSFEAMLNYYKANYPRGTPVQDSPAATGSTPPTTDSAPIPGTVGCPVLVIHGLDDAALLPAGFDGTWRWVDGELTVISLPGVGHFVQHQATELVTRTIESWLGR